jgi:hypothetical protein
MRSTGVLLAGALVALTLTAEGEAAGPAEQGGATQPNVRPTVFWLVAQLIPSPEVAAGGASALFGLRWQVTPLLYSFGINRRLSPWRELVVEPLVRQAGSLELYGSPEYIAIRDGLLLRAGVRSYFPLVEKGDYLSVSIGSSAYLFQEHGGAAFEVGAYAMFGMVGLQLTYSPTQAPIAWITTFRIRYF